MSILASFWKPEGYGQIVLPDRSILIEQKLVENARLRNSNGTFWVEKRSLKVPKIVNFDEFFKTWRLQSNSVSRHVILNT